jgi:predicted nuclease of restriction endonuclease-like RecB superfamily
MLTTDLVRTRTKKGRVEPLYLDTDSTEAQDKARELIAIFAKNAGGQYGDVDEAVERAIGHGTDFLIWRGLAKLLYDRSEFETVASVDPQEIRRAVFEASGELGPVTGADARQKVLEKAAEALELSTEEIEASLYADLEARQRLVEFDELEPLELLHRYNLALAQAVLYKATSLTIDLGDRDPNMLRYLFQALKFNRLMHRAYRLGGDRLEDKDTGEGYRLEVDGPASVFKKSRKYGLQMATFLPALLLADTWAMRAELDWKGNGKVHELVLSHKDGLVSHYKARGQWVAEEEKYFEKRFGETETDWTLERQGTIVELDKNQVIIPDYRLNHPDGREVYVEIVGFWRLAYLERRIEMLVDSCDVPLVLVVSERLKTGRKELGEAPAEVVFFKGVILVDKVLDAVEVASR